MQKWQLIFERTLFILVLVMLVFIPLYPKLPLFNVANTFVAIRLEDFLIAAITFVWIGYLLLSQTLKVILQSRINRLLFLFWGIGALSLFSGIFLTHTTLPHLGLLHYLRRIEFMILLPIAVTAIKNLHQVKISLITLAVVVFLVNIYALGQQYLGWPVISTGNSEFSKGLILYLTPGARVNSTFAGHYDLAIFLSLVLVAAVPLFFVVNKYWKVLLVFLSILSFYILVLTAARQAFVATLMGAIVGLWLIKKRIIILLMLIIASLTLIYPSQLRDRFISTITINIQKGGDRYVPENNTKNNSQFNIPTLQLATPVPTKNREVQEATKSATQDEYIASDIAPGEPTDTTQLGVYRSLGIRVNYEWPAAIRAFTKNPLIGTGYASLGLATDNDVLRSLGEVGLLGTVAFILLLIEIIRTIRTNINSVGRLIRFFKVGVIAMILAFILNAMFIDAFEASKVAVLFWIIIGIALATQKKDFNHTA